MKQKKIPKERPVNTGQEEGAANMGTEKQKRSQETRERIRSARTGTKHSVATRRKMSAAHMGLSHSQVNGCWRIPAGYANTPH